MPAKPQDLGLSSVSGKVITDIRCDVQVKRGYHSCRHVSSCVIVSFVATSRGVSPPYSCTCGGIEREINQDNKPFEVICIVHPQKHSGVDLPV